MAESSTWWVADWLAYGETTFRGRYREAIERTSLDYQTLRNYAWVARRFELSRRRDNLSFGHHAEVAALDPPEQDYWLRKAEELSWSRNHLRSVVRASLRERKTENEDGQEVIEGSSAPSIPPSLCLKITSAQFAQFTATAAQLELGLEDWAIQVLESAAKCLHGSASL